MLKKVKNVLKSFLFNITYGMGQHHTQTNFGFKKKQKISNLLVELIHIYPKFVPSRKFHPITIPILVLLLLGSWT